MQLVILCGEALIRWLSVLFVRAVLLFAAFVLWTSASALDVCKIIQCSVGDFGMHLYDIIFIGRQSRLHEVLSIFGTLIRDVWQRIIETAEVLST